MAFFDHHLKGGVERHRLHVLGWFAIEQESRAVFLMGFCDGVTVPRFPGEGTQMVTFSNDARVSERSA